MIAVKLNGNLRVKQEDGTYRIFQEGTIFRAKNRSELPEWLITELKYFESTATRDSLIVTESLPKASKSASDKEKKEASVKKSSVKSTSAKKAIPKKVSAKPTIKKRKK